MQKYSPDIKPRRLRFSLVQPTPKLWHGNSDIKTYHFNALAIFLPLLEQLVVLSIKKALKEVSSPKLKSEVMSLVAQEAIHGAEFNRINNELILPHYALRSSQFKLRFFRVLTGLINRFSSNFHYGLSAAGEHFTAIAADLFLREPLWFEGVSPVYSAIWRWHCIEEIEHKSVAFDVFKAKKGRYFIRILAMLIMTGVFSVLYIKPIWSMMKQDKNHKKLSFYGRALKYYWGKGGLCRKLFKPYLDYFKPHFHPTQHANEHLIKQWKIYFQTATQAQMVEQLQFVDPPC